jgi:hypothetical protein
MHQRLAHTRSGMAIVRDVLLFATLAAAVGANARADVLDRSLGCAAYAGDARAGELCTRLERGMQWTWMGHALPAPGWRITRDTLRRVWCEARLGPSDAPALRTLSRARDGRLEGAAGSLLHLIAQDEPENSILNAHHPQFVLRQGCGKDNLPR